MAKNKMFKEYQRKLNKLTRAMNKNIEEDDLWLGRFVIRQKESYLHIFNDNSGGVLQVIFRICDKKTGYYKDYWFDYAPYFTFNEGRLWRLMNDFITKDSSTWKKDNPHKNRIDYRKVKISSEIMNKEFNFYLAEEELKNGKIICN